MSIIKYYLNKLLIFYINEKGKKKIRMKAIENEKSGKRKK
jgi:hypothetical protein